MIQLLLKILHDYLKTLDEEIERAELNDIADSRLYTLALKERRYIKRLIRRLERIDHRRIKLHKRKELK